MLTTSFALDTNRYELKLDMVGEHHHHEGHYLNRRITWDPSGYRYEGDETHVNILVEEWDMREQ